MALLTELPDLRDFLDDVRRNLPDEIRAVPEAVPLGYTSTALALELERRGRTPPSSSNRSRAIRARA